MSDSEAWNAFERDLVAALRRGLQVAARKPTAALYVQFDPDDRWACAVYLCPEYRPASDDDDGWCEVFHLSLSGPAAPAGPDTNFDAVAEAVERAAADLDFGDVALCTAPSGARPVTRIREPVAD